MAQCRGRTIEQGNIETITSKTIRGHRIGKHQKHRSNVELVELAEMSEQGQSKVEQENVGNVGNVRASLGQGGSRNMAYDT